MTKVLETNRSVSISAPIGEQIEATVNADDKDARAAASAIARLERGLQLRGGPMVSRDELYER